MDEPALDAPDPGARFRALLWATFRQEAQGHAELLARALAHWPAGAGAGTAPMSDAARALLAEMFRAAHSLKGAARAAGAARIEGHGLALEQRLAVLLNGPCLPSPAQCAALREEHAALLRALDLPGDGPDV